jgi:hypothetical protein
VNDERTHPGAGLWLPAVVAAYENGYAVSSKQTRPRSVHKPRLLEAEIGAVVARYCKHRAAPFQQRGLMRLSTLANDWAAELSGERPKGNLILRLE